MQQKGIIIISLFIFLVGLIQGQQIYRQQLNDFNFRQGDLKTWHRANVPSTVHLDLLANNLIQDPYYRANQLDMYWIETKEWEYLTIFNLTNPSILSSRVVNMVFEGLDTHAEITLNGNKIFDTDNMYRIWTADVKNILYTVNNTLSVYFRSAPVHDEEKAAEQLPLVLPQNYSYSRKAAYQYGWDWGPRLVTCGIWKPIIIEAYNNSKINSIHLRTLNINGNTSAEMQITVQFDIAFFGMYRLVIVNVNNTEKIVDELIPLQDIISSNKKTYNFIIKNPQIWWTRDQGAANLYTFNISLYYKNVLHDFRNATTGIRIVKVLQNKDARNNGTSFMVNLNGQDLYMKGGNYIPPDMFMPRAFRNQTVYQQTIQDAVDANYNMIRLWGGGQFEFDIFYDLCDQNGLLVWHDLLFACAMYPGDDMIYDNVKHEMEDNVKRLRNHPSIALWNGNNEVYIGWLQWGWQNNMTTDQRKEVWGWYEKIFNKVIPDVLRDEDPDRYYWPTSPSTPYTSNITQMDYGDIHYWGVWAGGEDFETYNQYIGRFNSEYGMQGMLAMDSIKQFSIAMDWNIDSQVMQIHERHPQGWPLIKKYMAEYMQNPTSFENYVYTTQVMQSYALQIGIEATRRAKPYNMGSLYWQLNDVWPVISWSTVDYYGTWKAAHYKIRDLFKNIMLSCILNPQNNNYEIYIVSDYTYEVQGQLVINITDFFGTQYKITTINLKVNPGVSTLVQYYTANDLIQFNLNGTLIHMNFTSQNQQSFENIYYFTRPLNWQLPSPVYKVGFNATANTISIYSKYLAKSFYIFIKDYTSALKLSDNYFDILPGRTRVVQVLNANISTIQNSIQYMSLIESYWQSPEEKEEQLEQ